MPRPRSAVAVVPHRTTEGFKYLVVKNLKRDGWVFPGGKAEPGELPSDAMVRELKEETGVDARGWYPLYEGVGDGVERIITVFLVTSWEAIVIAAESAEHPPPRWESFLWILNNTCFPEFYARLGSALRRQPSLDLD